MTWFMNFCAPFIPNDPTINFNRYVQASLLVIYTLAYIILHIYFRCKMQNSIQPLSELEDIPHRTTQLKSPHIDEQKSKEDEQSSAQSLSHPSQFEKSVSIKIQEINNDECFQIKKTNNLTENKGIKKELVTISSKGRLNEIQSYFPIVYGHFAVAVGVSIMYTPYAEQSIACIIYQLLTVPLLIFNVKGYPLWVNAIWILMALVVLFLLTCGLLQVGQSNWDINNLTCFSTEYVSLYDI